MRNDRISRFVKSIRDQLFVTRMGMFPKPVDHSVEGLSRAFPPATKGYGFSIESQEKRSIPATAFG